MHHPSIRSAAALVCLLLFAPAAGAEEGLVSLERVNACIEANVPKTTSIQTVEFSAVDKVGYERVTRAKIYVKRAEDGPPKVLTLFTRPLDLRGAQYLMLGSEDGGSEMFVYTPELRATRRITGNAAGGQLFGTDFTYEDFERLHRMNKPGASKLLENAVVMDRPVYVIETVPAENTDSSYEEVVTFWDQKTCVALKTESYENGRRLRKVLTANPDEIIQHGDVWVVQDMTMEDVRDKTHTRLVVESVEVGVKIRDRTFNVSQLGKNLR